MVPWGWLAEVLLAVVKDKLVTSARPPRVDVILMSYPSPDEIHKYTFTLPSDRQWVDHTSATLNLLFYKTSPVSVYYETNNVKIKIASMMNPSLFRSFLDPSGDEVNSTYKFRKFHDLREKGPVTWTTFDWDIMMFKARAWMYNGTVDTMIKEGWKVDLAGIGMWENLFEAPPVMSQVVEKGECWGTGEPEVDWDLD